MTEAAATYNAPFPVPDFESLPYWQGLRDHKLMLQRCRSSGRHQFPPTTFCPGSLETPEWVQASGRGILFSWIVVRHPVPRDVYADLVPYVVALVELDEGCRMPANLVGVAPKDIVAGMPVAIVYRDVTGEITLPAFAPIGEA